MVSRRDVLALGAAGSALLLARRVRAIGERSRFRFGHLRLDQGNWNPRPGALRRVAWEIEKRTSIDIDREPVTLTLLDPKLHETPFLYLAGDGAFPLPSRAEIEALRRFLTFGGFLLIDSAEGRLDGAFDRSVRNLVEAVYPRPAAQLALIPADHVLYKSFYLVDRPVGRLAISPILEGIAQDDRISLAYSQNDLGGAWDRDPLGNYRFRCEPEGEVQRERAFRLGINLVMYALCLEYKTDQVHVPFILKRRRWRSDDSP
jgi:hypothetical protein